MNRILKRYDLSQIEEKIEAAKELVLLIAETDSAVTRDIYARIAAERLEISADAILLDVMERETPFVVGGNKTKGSDYVDLVGLDRISVLFFDGCFNWISGKPCKFCQVFTTLPFISIKTAPSPMTCIKV